MFPTCAFQSGEFWSLMTWPHSWLHSAEVCHASLSFGSTSSCLSTLGLYYVPKYMVVPFDGLKVRNYNYCKYWFCRRCYIRFIRKVNEKKGLEGQEETRKAFDFMLSYVGLLSFSWLI